MCTNVFICCETLVPTAPSSPKMIRLDKLFVLVLLTLSLIDQAGSNTYAVILLGQTLQTNTPSTNIQYELLMLNQGQKSIVVEIKRNDLPLKKVNLPSNGYGNVLLNETEAMNGTEYANKTLKVSSDGNFTLQVFSSQPSHKEGYLGIPLESLMGPNQIGNVYEYVVTTFCATSGYCQMAVTGFNDVKVKFTFPPHIEDVTFCMGIRVIKVGRDGVLTLARGHAVQIETTEDLTGTHIYSYNPIVVIVGSRNVAVSEGSVHMMEQLAPSSQWGRRYAVTPLGDLDYGDVVRISASWPNTKVYMTGFNSFVISKNTDVVSRRLVKDSLAFITANHPIQVIQITGLTNGTGDSSLTVAMVTIPAIEHATDSLNISCGLSTATTNSGKFFIVSEKATVPTIQAMPMSDSLGILFTKYKISIRQISSSTVYDVQGSQIAGLVTCNNHAVLPLSSIHHGVKPQQNKSQTTDYKSTTCVDGVTGFMSNASSPFPSISDSLDGFFVLKLRVITCGEMWLSLYNDVSTTIFHITNMTVRVIWCPKNKQGCELRGKVTDNFNSGRQCASDMAWFWIRKLHTSTSFNICYGFGPVVSSDCSDAPYNHHYATTDPRYIEKSFSLTSLGSSIYFSYDLESEDDCTARISNWRCEDKIPDCSTYRSDFCKDQSHSNFSEEICPKFCGKCSVDSYGRRFVFPLVTGSHQTLVLITPLEDDTHIGVATNMSVVKYNSMHGDTKQYEIPSSANLVWIVTDKDVAVTVRVRMSIEYLWFSMYNVFPVDSFSTDFLVLTACEVNCVCNIVTDSTTVDVTVYTSGSLQNSNEDIIDGHVLSVTPYSVSTIGEKIFGSLNQATKFSTSTKPFGVFCGDQSVDEGFSQMFPVNVYGKHYRIPIMNVLDPIYQSLQTQVVLQGLHTNTRVEIEGLPGSPFTLETRGQIQHVTVIDQAQPYEIHSNVPVAVGLVVNSATGGTPDQFLPSKIFLLLPPVESYITNAMIFRMAGMMPSISYISMTGQTETITPMWETKQGQIVEAKFGIIGSIQMENQNYVVPTYSKLVPLPYQADVCHTSTMIINDGLDNDCDGITDEDTCPAGYGIYGKETDQDSDFRRDCGGTISEPVVVPPIPEPICIPLEELLERLKIYHCWTACTCPCPWAEQLKLIRNMTTAQINEFNERKIKKIEQNLTVDVQNLTSSKSQKISAEDDRQSAANVGYVGITMFALVFGCIIIMDMGSVYRDLKTIMRNLRIGWKRFARCIRCKKRTANTGLKDAPEKMELR